MLSFEFKPERMVALVPFVIRLTGDRYDEIVCDFWHLFDTSDDMECQHIILSFSPPSWH